MYQEKVRDVSSRSSVIWRMGNFSERAGMDGLGRGLLCIMRDWIGIYQMHAWAWLLEYRNEMGEMGCNDGVIG